MSDFLDLDGVASFWNKTKKAIRIMSFRAMLTVKSPAGIILTISGGDETFTVTSTGKDVFTIHNLNTDYIIEGSHGGRTSVKHVYIVENKIFYDVVINGFWRYGFRKKKVEGSPTARMEYIYDAVGMTPAHMDFTTGTFDYGSWGDLWFVKDNKPLMLKSDRTVDYYLNPDDYTKKADGTASDISNTAYDGNGMAQFPLAYFYRHEDDTYEYEIVSDGPYDENYKAYAHTRADGSIADYFYWSLFGGSGNANKIRSLAGQTAIANLSAQQEVDGCKANGNGWYTHTWSQREYIRTLLVLMGKSTNTQAVYGTGNCRSSSTGPVLQTGTLKDKGQFFGYNSSTQQVKIFHIEKFWGDQWDRTAGVINNKGTYYVKMTPEGQGYRVTDITGMDKIAGISVPSAHISYISGVNCSEYGCLPIAVAGSATTYECDIMWSNNGQFNYLVVGTGAYEESGNGGAFALSLDDAPSYARWTVGCGLSAEQPPTAEQATT